MRVGSLPECRALGCIGPRSVSLCQCYGPGWSEQEGQEPFKAHVCNSSRVHGGQCINQSPKRALCLMDVNSSPKSGVSSFGGLTCIQGAPAPSWNYVAHKSHDDLNGTSH